MEPTHKQTRQFLRKQVTQRLQGMRKTFPNCKIEVLGMKRQTLNFQNLVLPLECHQTNLTFYLYEGKNRRSDEFQEVGLSLAKTHDKSNCSRSTSAVVVQKSNFRANGIDCKTRVRNVWFYPCGQKVFATAIYLLVLIYLEGCRVDRKELV